MLIKIKWLVIALMITSHHNQALAVDSDIEAKIHRQLKAMTVAEKVGQMTQVDLSTIIAGKDEQGQLLLDENKLNEAINKYKVGSILNAGGSGITPQHWRKILTKIQDKALKTEQAIPVLYGIDAIHGATFTEGATLFPHNIGMGASRNTDLVKQAAKVTAKEVRASGIRWNFDPVLDIARQPLWPRFGETFGEDTHLITEMGLAAIIAYEEDGLDSPTAVASTMKHFVGYSNPASGKDRTPAYIPEITMKEYYLPQFEAAIKAGSSTIMINSASVNGIAVHANKAILTDLLRDELGFKGLVVTDWEDIIRLHERHRVADSQRSAVKLAIDAGIDMSMVPLNYSFAKLLVDLVEKGEITEQRIDYSVANILRLKHQLGLFKDPYPEKSAFKGFGRKEYKTIAKQAALESITLLKNEANVLPLTKKSKVLLVGPAVDNLAPLHGAWSFSWQGDVEANYPKSTQTLLQAFQEKVGKKNIVTVAAKGYDSAGNYDVNKLIKLAKDVDYIVLALGENAYAESPGVINDLTLASNQLALAKAATTTGKPVVLVLVEGRPRVISTIEPQMNAIVQAYLPGSQGAAAITDVIYGDYNPSGILPYTYPRHTGDIVPYDRLALADFAERSPGKLTTDGYNPQWPFGHGLSYTKFIYSPLVLSHEKMQSNDTLSVTVTVKNTGDYDGQHTVELYLSDIYASVSPSVKKLKRFKKILLKKGQAKTLKFDITKKDLRMVNANLDWVVEVGEFVVSIGDKKVSFTYQ